MTNSPGATTAIDPFTLLAREDKWYLSNGEGALFAPPFPVWLDAPGFWDEATVFQYAFAPVFTVAILDDAGDEVTLTPLARRWTPAELILDYRLGNGMTATEVRTIQPGGVFASEWRIRAFRRERIHLVAWTAQEAAGVAAASVSWRGGLTFQRRLTDSDGVASDVIAELACTGGASSWSAVLGEESANHPHWRLTPFVEQWRPDGLPCDVRASGDAARGLLYAAVHREVTLDGESGSATFAMRLATLDAPGRDALPHALAPHAFTLGGASRRRWREHFDAAPLFRCADPYLESYFWYRWYGVGLAAIEPSGTHWKHPAMCEGIASRHVMRSRSAHCHVRELRWLDPARAAGVLRSFLAAQRSDGSLPARILPNHTEGHDNADSNWGDALLALDSVAPEQSLLEEAYPRLAKFSEWLVRARDARGTNLIDAWDDDEGSARKGVAPTVYAYALWRALERLALRLGDTHAVTQWGARAARTTAAVRDQMWDPVLAMFCDVDVASGRRVATNDARSFYPYLTDIAGEMHVSGVERNLLDQKRFWTPFPVPFAPIGDASGLGVERTAEGASPQCRVRPITNCNLVEALAGASSYAPRLRPRVTELLRRFIHMLFHDGDLRRPNCFEHYNPFTGHASVHRGIDDHQQSWVNDLVISYVMGIRPHPDGITIDPFPAGLEFAEMTNVRLRGRTLGVLIQGDRVRVTSDGATFDTIIGDAIEISD